MDKKSKEYRDLDYKQSTLKSALHQNWRQHYKWRVTKTKGDKTKPAFNMIELENQQKEINKIRKQMDMQPITLFADFKKTLRHL